MNIIETAAKVEAVKRTLQTLDIQSTWENMDKILGCLNALEEVKSALVTEAEKEARAEKEAKQDGNADAE